MPVIPSTYKSPTLIPGGHLQTILPAIFRKVTAEYRRERLELADGDFLDLDWKENPATNYPKRLIILSHGLEGDSKSQFLVGIVNHLHSLGYNCLAWHYRSCSGEMNRLQRFYHLGETGDLTTVVDLCLNRGFEELALVGFSAGGNVTLKYLGERGGAISPAVKAGVVFSTPLDLAGSSSRIQEWDSWIYNQRFTKSMKKKVLLKAEYMPDFAGKYDMRKVTDLASFDVEVTAPLHGFASAAEYYRDSSSLFFLKDIRVPTLMVNALNDPLFSRSCFPTDEKTLGPNVLAEYTTGGGHCGFSSNRLQQKVYWSEWRCAEYLSEIFENAKT